MFAVVDNPVDAPGIVRAIDAAGIDTSDVALLRGAEGAARIDATGAASGLRARIAQILSFAMVDQMPDFILYEAAVLDGRAVVAVPIRTEAEKRTALGILRDRGAHFINLYGRFATEELDLWRGPELPIPDVLRR